MREQTPDNGFVVVAEILTKPKKDSGIINPNTGRDTAPVTEYDEHPWRGLVIFAPKYYYVGSARFESDIKNGDIVTLPGDVIERGTAFLIMDGSPYPAIRYSSVITHYTPTDAERKALILKKDVPKPILSVPIAQA